MKHWKVLHRQPENRGQCLILLINQDLVKALKKTGYRVFMGFSEGNFIHHQS
jgi:hypothetical protein